MLNNLSIYQLIIVWIASILVGSFIVALVIALFCHYLARLVELSAIGTELTKSILSENNINDKQGDKN